MTTSPNRTTANHADFNGDFRRWTNSTIDCPTCMCDLSFGDLCTLTSPVVPPVERNSFRSRPL